MSFNQPLSFTRRQLLSRFTTLTAGAAALWYTPGLFAEELTRTPRQTGGPFYPDKLPLDTDNDLLLVNDAITPGVGEVTHLTGKIVDASGNPLRNAVVEIWQCDGTGVYHHSRDSGRKKHDSNFQGFGRFTTDSTGRYYFRTIKPVPYPGRTPHIHYKVKRSGKELLTTQCYIKGHSQNEKDGVFRGIKDPKARQSVEVEFTPIKASKVGELAANFDIVLGLTPEA